MTEKVRENRMRRIAERQRLRLIKARPRDTQSAPGYMLIDDDNNPVAGGKPAFSLDLDGVERFLTKKRK